MEVAQTAPTEAIDYDLEKEIKDFEESKAGVKGLADSGQLKIPRIFHKLAKMETASVSDEGLAQVQVPVVDLGCLATSRHLEIVKEVSEAAETWGFFQIVSHGIPLSVMEGVLEGISQFHEQPTEVKREIYSHDAEKVRYHSNTLLRATKQADWRDTLTCEYHDGVLDAEMIPPVCRNAVSKYMEHMGKLKEMLTQLLSEALGLNANYLSSIECMNSAKLAGNYYPPCPEPNLTMGATKHSDPLFLTVLLQDGVGGLQVLHQNRWVDVRPVAGALIVNIGDLMQLITNDKFKSVEHRVLARKERPRVSIACFLHPGTESTSRLYGPIPDLISLENRQARYRETSMGKYMEQFKRKGLDGNSTLPYFKQ